MDSEERLTRLEHRITVLEDLVRQLAATARPQARPVPPAAPQRAPAPPRPPVEPPRPPPPSDLRRLLTSEQWIGQRGLLAVGVIALILAAGYLLKLSFERGWISPLVRCLGGVLAGAVVGGIGWRLQDRYRTYGASLIGCGAAILYLSVWAASRLYDIIPPTPAIAGLALVSLSLAAIAYAIDVEALGATAALGAFFAPVLLGRTPSDANLLLIYLACMAAGLGWVAAAKRWRLAGLIVAASYFGLGGFAAVDSRSASPVGLLLFGVAGGTAGLYLGLRERWGETRFLAFGGGWMMLGAASDRLESGWPIFLAALVLAAPVWWHGLRRPDYLPLRIEPGSRAGGWSLGEAIYFFATPVLVGWALREVAPAWFDARDGSIELAVAVPYLLAGYVRSRPAFALVGAAAAAAAAAERWSGVELVWALLALSLVWVALDLAFRRADGRWYALITFGAALLYYLDNALDRRESTSPAFVDSWALAQWALAGVAAFLAGGPVRPGGNPQQSGLIRFLLWVIAGGVVLFGVTGEIARWFAQRGLGADTASLASGLGVSAWWLLFAAALVTVGFRRDLKPVRLAGLAVAGLAIAKVIFFDLSSLDALYRVGSVFILGLVSLSLAYLYHRQARTEERAEGGA